MNIKNMTSKIGSIARNRSTKVAVAIAAVPAIVVGLAAASGATAYDPTSALTSFASTATSTAAPIVLAVAGSLIALAIVFWAVGYVFGFFGKKRRA
jgi:hypothetical protein